MTDGFKATPPLIEMAPLRVIENPQTAANSSYKFEPNQVLASEVPVSISYNGVAHSVVMASPMNLPELVVGYSLTQAIIAKRSDIQSISVVEGETGVLADAVIDEKSYGNFLHRKRNVVGQTGCGVCGIINLEDAFLALPSIDDPGYRISPTTIFACLEAFRRAQKINRRAGSIHGAGLFDRDGSLLAVREDVGRHNALDKLIGYLFENQQLIASRCFVILSSRCSYELVEKTAIARIPLLVTISAPTELAIIKSREAQLALVAMARGDSMSLYHDVHGIVQ